MRTRVVVMAMALALTAPVAALANDGILLLAHNGTPEWNARVNDLVAKVDAQRPADVVFGLPAIAKPDAPTDREKQQIRVTIERNSALGRRILVVPVLLEGSRNPVVEQLLEGLSYEVTSGGIISDDRVAQAIAASAVSR